MDDDRLMAMLREADAAAGPAPLLPADLAVRVRRTARRRRVAWIGATSTVAGLSLLFVAVKFHEAVPRIARPEPSPTPSRTVALSAAEDAALRAQIAHLQAQAASHQAIADYMLDRRAEDQRLTALEAKLAAPDTQAQVDQELERTALLMLSHSQRVCLQANAAATCQAALERVVTLFPRTTAALLARQRLTELF